MNDGQLYCNLADPDSAIQPLVRGQPFFEGTHHFAGFENRMREGSSVQYLHCIHLFRVVGDNSATAGPVANFYLIEYKLHIPVRFAKSQPPKSQHKIQYYICSTYSADIPPTAEIAGLKQRSAADGGCARGYQAGP